MFSNNSQQDLISTVRNAVLVQHSHPNTKMFEDARKYIENFEASLNSIEITFKLTSTSESDHIRLFAFSSINKIIEINWENMNPSQKETIKTAIISLMKSGTHDIIEEKPFIKEKIAQILCTIAKIEWPIPWKNMVDEILEIANNSSITLEIVLIFLKNLSADITEYKNNLSIKRTMEMKDCLSKNSRKICELFEATFQCCLDRLSSDNKDSLISKKLLKTSLNCLIPNIIFLPASLFQGTIINLLCKLCFNSEFYFDSIKCLSYIVSKKRFAPSNVKTTIYNRCFLQIWNTTICLLEHLANAKMGKNIKNEYLNILIDTIIYLFRNHKFTLYRKTDTTDTLKEKLTTNLIKIFESSDNDKFASQFTLWKILLENEFISINTINDFKKFLINTCFDKSGELTDDSYNEKSELIKSIDSLIMIIIKKDKFLLLSAILDRLKLILSSNIENDNLNILGLSTKKSKLYIIWEDYFRILKICLSYSNIPRVYFHKKNKNKVHIAFESILNLLLMNNINDHLIIELFLRNVGKFYLILKENTEAFNTVVKYLFSIFTRYPFPKEHINPTNEKSIIILANTYSLRKQALYAILSLTKSCKKSFVQIFEPFVKQVMELLNETKETFEDLSEFITILINIMINEKSLPSPSEFIENILNESINYLTSVEISTVLLDLKSFSMILNMDQKSILIINIIKTSLNKLVAVLQGLSKIPLAYKIDPKKYITFTNYINENIAPIIWTALKKVLPTVLKLCLRINSIYNQSNSNYIHPDLHVIFYSNHHIDKVIQKLYLIKNYKLALIIKTIKNAIFKITEQSYSIIILATSLPEHFFALDPKCIIDTILYSIEFLPSNLLKPINDRLIYILCIRSIRKVNNIDNFILPIFDFYLQKILLIIKKEWPRFYKVADSQKSTSNFEHEIYFESSLIDFARSLSKIFLVICNSHSKKKNTTSSISTISSTTSETFIKILFSNESITSNIGCVCIAMFNTPDSICQRNIFKITNVMVNAILNEPKYYKFVGTLLVESMKSIYISGEAFIYQINFILMCLKYLSKHNKDGIKEFFSNVNINREDMEYILKTFYVKSFYEKKSLIKKFLMNYKRMNARF